MSALKKYPRGVGMGICGGAGVTCTLTDTGPLLAIDLFSVESSIGFIVLSQSVEVPAMEECKAWVYIQPMGVSVTFADKDSSAYMPLQASRS